MALDETLARACASGGPPTLRFYGWRRPTLSIGRHQRLTEAADLGACERLGVEVVRRPTGGRAVLHEEEITYALAAPAADPLLAGGFRCALRRLARALVAGLRGLGVPADLATPEAAPPGPGTPSAVPCFFSPARDEILAGGLKIAAAAQWRLPGALLQHGSIPLRIRAERLLLSTGVQRGAPRPGGPQALPGGLAIWLKEGRSSEAGTAGRSLSGLPVAARVIEALRRGIEDALGVRLAEGDLRGEEIERAGRLEREVYATRAWLERL